MSKTVYEILMKLSGASGVERDLESAERSVNLVAQAASAVAGPMMRAGDALISFSQRAAEANAQMERGLTNLGNISGASRDELVGFNEDLTEVLETTGYQIQRNDLLTSSYDAASAGFTDTADAMAVMTSASKLAIAGNSGLTDATDNMASSQKAVIAGMKSYAGELESYGSTAEQAAVVSDKMYKIIKLGITDIGALAPEFAELAPSAAAAGLSMDELSASYAALTSAGIKTNIATTNMKALISSIARGGPTEEAKKMIDELGLSFDTTALSTKGLAGILEELDRKGVTGLDQYLKLTGSQEAATALAALSAQDYADKLDYIKTGTVDLQELVDNLSDDPLGRLTEATNRFDDALALAGDNLAPIKTDLMGLATDVLDAFNDLPEGLQKFIGSFIVVGGAASKAGGGMLQAAADIAIAKMAFGQFAAKVPLATAAMKGFNLSMVPTAAALGTIAATAGVALAAIASLTLAYKQYQNVVEENDNMMQSQALENTEHLAQKAQILANRMRETGEAIPQKEFDIWIQAMTEADAGTGVLQGQIDALNRLQEKAKQGTLESTDATQEKTQADKELAKALEQTATGTEAKAKADKEAVDPAKAAEDAARAQEEAYRELYATLNDGLDDTANALSDFNTELSNQVQDGTITTSQAYEERAKALKVYSESAKALYREALGAEELTASQRKEIQDEQTRALKDNHQKQIELQREWAAELKKINREAMELEALQLDVLAEKQGWTQEKLTSEHRRLKREQLQATIATIEAELSAVVQGSEKQRQLNLELYRNKAELGRIGIQIKSEEAKAAEEAAKAEAKAAEDAARAKVEAAQKAKEQRLGIWKAETAAYELELATRLSQSQNIAARINAALANQSSLNGIASGELGNFSTNYDNEAAAKGKILDITRQIAELEAQQQETGESKTKEIAALTTELEKQRKIQALSNVELKNSAALLGEMGTLVGVNLTQEQQAVQMALRKVAIENENLLLKFKQETIANRLRVLEQERLILELQRQATMEGITETEAKNLQLQIQNAEATKALIREQQAANADLVDLQRKSNISEARTGLAGQGIDPGELGKEFKDANKVLSNELNKSLGADLGKVTEATKGGSTSIKEALDSQTQGLTGGLDGLGQGFNSAINPVNIGIQNMQGNLQSGFGSSVAATQAQTTELSQQLRALQSAVAAVPGQIAAALPRNESTTRE